jgi:hypothetical protein
MQPMAIRLLLRCLLAASLFATGGLVAAVAPAQPADTKGKVPPELDVIPRDSMCVISVRVPALRDNKANRWLLDLANDPALKPAIQPGAPLQINSWADLDKRLADDLGIAGSTLERVSLVVGKIDIAKLQNQPDQIPVAGVFSVNKAYDRARVLKAVVPVAKEEKHGGHTYHFDKTKHMAVHFLNDRSFVIGTEASIKEFLSQPEKKPASPAMDSTFQLAAESAIVIGINPESLAPIVGVLALAAPVPEPGATLLREFLDLKAFVLCLDIDEMIRFDLLLQCTTERDQKAIAESLRKGLELSRQSLAPIIADPNKPKEMEPYVPLLKGIEAALKATDVREEGLHLHLPLYIRPDTGKPAKAATPLADKRLDEMWNGLARQGIAGMRASYLNAHTMAATPEPTLKLLKERLKPTPALDAAERTAIDERIKDLDSEEFDRRERATLELIKLGSRARPAIQARLDGELGSLEMRRRLERIMEKLKGGLSPEEHRDLRAVEVLERIGTPEAKELLRVIAEGQPGAPLTRAAKERLKEAK